MLFLSLSIVKYNKYSLKKSENHQENGNLAKESFNIFSASQFRAYFLLFYFFFEVAILPRILGKKCFGVLWYTYIDVSIVGSLIVK